MNSKQTTITTENTTTELNNSKHNLECHPSGKTCAVHYVLETNSSQITICGGCSGIIGRAHPPLDWAVTFIPLPMSKTVCRALSQKTWVQSEVCRTDYYLCYHDYCDVYIYIYIYI